MYLLLTLAFLLEIVAFISFAAFGSMFYLHGWLGVALFVVLLVALILFWGVYMAPKAPKKFSPLPYYSAKCIIYAISATTLYATRGVVFGTGFAVLAVLDEVLLFRHNLS